MFKTAISAGMQRFAPPKRSSDQDLVSKQQSPPRERKKGDSVVVAEDNKAKNSKTKSSPLTVDTRGVDSAAAAAAPPDPSQRKKMVYSVLAVVCIVLGIWHYAVRNNKEIMGPQAFCQEFLLWLQDHPLSGLLALAVVIATAVVFMVPIGTPLTVGCGYIYKAAYGWKIGLALATAVSMGGSALGAVTCFLLGRYWMRATVRQWVRHYPLFDAIDIAAAEHGLRIMAMLYLTPVLPLGPVSYMCGTTSMALSSFVIAKIASLPLMFLYVSIGASTGALFNQKELDKLEENQTLVWSGLTLSAVMIYFISKSIRKELNSILEQQKREKEAGKGDDDEDAGAVEMGLTPGARQRRNK